MNRKSDKKMIDLKCNKHLFSQLQKEGSKSNIH